MEVVIKYNPDNEQAVEFAYDVEERLPARWSENNEN